ncbi:hypothetical protein CYMTET_40371 [Cymbomonas tetramitiformis]|uniref:Uncharacterized protein n=1 Tax=Cymbomonas tetramitiformis TaxID=36881 RepID=A0AAE0CAF0_9CHLO|nr:hypothetical protein CYMTET_40371 [Cymbomonas tetramitiformis]
MGSAQSNPTQVSRSIWETTAYSPFTSSLLIPLRILYQTFSVSRLKLSVCLATVVAPARVEDDVRRAASRYGHIQDVYLPKDYYSGEPRGIGFIQYPFLRSCLLLFLRFLKNFWLAAPDFASLADTRILGMPTKLCASWIEQRFGDVRSLVPSLSKAARSQTTSAEAVAAAKGRVAIKVEAKGMVKAEDMARVVGMVVVGVATRVHLHDAMKGTRNTAGDPARARSLAAAPHLGGSALVLLVQVTLVHALLPGLEAILVLHLVRDHRHPREILSGNVARRQCQKNQQQLLNLSNRPMWQQKQTMFKVGCATPPGYLPGVHKLAGAL